MEFICIYFETNYSSYVRRWRVHILKVGYYTALLKKYLDLHVSHSFTSIDRQVYIHFFGKKIKIASSSIISNLLYFTYLLLTHTRGGKINEKRCNVTVVSGTSMNNNKMQIYALIIFSLLPKYQKWKSIFIPFYVCVCVLSDHDDEDAFVCEWRKRRQKH